MQEDEKTVCTSCGAEVTENDAERCALCRKKFCSNCVVELHGKRYCANCKEDIIPKLRYSMPAEWPGPPPWEASRVAKSALIRDARKKPFIVTFLKFFIIFLMLQPLLVFLVVFQVLAPLGVHKEDLMWISIVASVCLIPLIVSMISELKKKLREVWIVPLGVWSRDFEGKAGWIKWEDAEEIRLERGRKLYMRSRKNKIVIKDSFVRFEEIVNIVRRICGEKGMVFREI